MDETEIRRRRTQMAHSVASWASGPGAIAEVGDGYWAILTGLPSPDMNVVLVHDADPQVRVEALALVESAGVPALLCLGGAARADGLAEEWQEVGSMPFMAARLDRTGTAPDARVRRAGRDDTDTVVDLLSDAYGMDRGLCADFVIPNIDAGPERGFWVLEQDGTPVSTAFTARFEDVVSVWCMGTPVRYARRGHGRAVLAHVLHEARLDGAEVGLLGATPAGKPLYDATGWQALEDWRLLVNASSAQFSG